MKFLDLQPQKLLLLWLRCCKKNSASTDFFILHLSIFASKRNGKSDPYVTLKLGQSSSQQHKTVVIPKTLNPVWLTEFDFTITPVMPEGSLVLDISVWDKDLIGKDFMGLVQIPISDGK